MDQGLHRRAYTGRVTQERLHRRGYIGLGYTGWVTQEALHRNGYTGGATQEGEDVHRSGYTGGVAQERLHRRASCLTPPVRAIVQLGKPSLYKTGGP